MMQRGCGSRNAPEAAQTNNKPKAKSQPLTVMLVPLVMLRMREVKPRAAKTHPKPQKEKPAAGGSVGDAEDGQSPNKHDPEKWYPLATEFEKHRKELFGTLGNSLPISLGQLSRQSGLDGFAGGFPFP